MSYISTIHPEMDDATFAAGGRQRVVSPGLTVTGGTSLLSGSLEAVLLVATLSLLSLVLCTVAAGAF